MDIRGTRLHARHRAYLIAEGYVGLLFRLLQLFLVNEDSIPQNHRTISRSLQSSYSSMIYDSFRLLSVFDPVYNRCWAAITMPITFMRDMAA